MTQQHPEWFLYLAELNYKRILQMCEGDTEKAREAMIGFAKGYIPVGEYLELVQRPDQKLKIIVTRIGTEHTQEMIDFLRGINPEKANEPFKEVKGS